MPEKTVYIHYGDDTFRTPNPIRNKSWFTKPYGGLWASRREGEQTWKDWCESEQFLLHTFNTNFEFTLKESAKILTLASIDQLDALPMLNTDENPFIKGNGFSECLLDFEKLSKEYDAIELVNISVFYWALYGWDCNSILIMNPDIVEVMKGEIQNGSF